MHAFTEDLQLLMEKEGQAELRLAYNKIGAQAAERLAGVLGQCSSPAKLVTSWISRTTAGGWHRNATRWHHTCKLLLA